MVIKAVPHLSVGSAASGAGAAVNVGTSKSAGWVLQNGAFSPAASGVTPSVSFNNAPVSVLADASAAAAETLEGSPVRAETASAAQPGSTPDKPASAGSVPFVAKSPDYAKSLANQNSVLRRVSDFFGGLRRFPNAADADLKAASDRRFDNTANRKGGSIVPSAGTARTKTSSTPRLARPGSLEAAKSATPGVEKISGRRDTSQPKSKISRALRIGALTAIVMLSIDLVVFAVGSASGYHFTPSYSMPAMSDPATYAVLGDFLAPIAAKIQDVFTIAFGAPYNEEVYFRAGAMGVMSLGAAKLAQWSTSLIDKFRSKAKSVKSWVAPLTFGIVSAEAAMFFAFLHEVSDPVLITVRIIQALLLSYLYVKEGLISGMAHHAVFNGLATLTMAFAFTSAAGTMAVLMPGALIVGILLAAAAYALWRFTRKSARQEAADMKSGKLVTYRLSSKASTWLGRMGWVSVAVFAVLGKIQATAGAAVLLYGMAAQMVPAVLAFQAYGFLMKNLERREGTRAVDAIRNPKEFFPMLNRVGKWVAGAFGASYIGILGASLLLRATAEFFPMAGLLPTLGIAGGIPVAIAGGLMIYRYMRGAKGISPWYYVAEFFFTSMAGLIFAMPWLLPFLQKLTEMATAAGVTQSLILPALSSAVWMFPLLIVLSGGMTLIGRHLMKSSSQDPKIVN